MKSAGIYKPALNRQHPFVDLLLSDITESGEVLVVSGIPGQLG